MKFKSITIEKETYGEHKDELKGKISFDTANGDTFYLRLDNEWAKKMIIDCLPLIERATNEKIEIIKAELKEQTDEK